MTKKFFFDLEETVINSWDDPVLCNVQTVKDFIQIHGVKEVTIFSAAVWNERDKEVFTKTMKTWLEAVFGVCIIEVVSSRLSQWKRCGNRRHGNLRDLKT